MSREGLLYQLVMSLNHLELRAFFLDEEQPRFRALAASAVIPPTLPQAHAKDGQ